MPSTRVESARGSPTAWPTDREHGARRPRDLVVLPHGLAVATAQRVLDRDEPHAFGELTSSPGLVELGPWIGQPALGQVAVHGIPEGCARQADALLGHAGGAGRSDDLGLLGENGHGEARDPRGVDPGLAGHLLDRAASPEPSLHLADRQRALRPLRRGLGIGLLGLLLSDEGAQLFDGGHDRFVELDDEPA